MFDSIEDRMQEILMLGTLFGGFIWIMLASQLFSPGVSEIIGPAGYFVIIFIGIFGVEVVVKEIVNSYPYIRMIVRPNNDEYDLFLLKGGKEENLGAGWHAAPLKLRYPIEMEEYGKLSRIKIKYKKTWSDRIRFQQGQAFWRGFLVGHPQTETIITYQTPKATTEVDHGEMIPVFTMHNASKDFYGKSDPVLMDIDIDNSAIKTVEQLTERYTTLQQKFENLRDLYSSVDSQSQEWHQRAITAEEIVNQQRIEQRSLLSSMTGVKDLAVSLMLGVIHACGSIEEGMKQLRSDKETPFLNKYVVIIVVSALVLLYLGLNPGVTQGFSIYMSNPINSLILLGIVIAAVVGIYFIFIRRGAKPKI